MHSDVLFSPVCEGDAPAATAARLQALYAGLGRPVASQDLVAIKTHFGERGNTTHVAPQHIRTLVDLVRAEGGNPYLTETSVLYKSQRMNAVSHILLAFQHGFTFEAVGAPIIMSDGLRGNLDREVEIHGDHYDRVAVAADAISPDRMIVVSHATGHLAAGFGAAIKNLGMGLSARKGKLSQHSASKPFVDREACHACQVCVRWCPEEAIALDQDKARIDETLCIGCGECITVCQPSAIGFRWDGASADLQRKMAEHAWGTALAMRDRIVYFNFLTDMTRDCDCMGASTKVLEDIGILASQDPVALDMATLALTRERAGKDLAALSFPHLDPMVQIEHAEKLGMGSREYRLVDVR
jgi:uncharacterized protein